MEFDRLKRRDFITLIGVAAATWPMTARAQPAERVRRVGVLMPIARSDPEAQKRFDALVHALRELGWLEAKTIAFEMRFADGKPERLPALAAELVQANVDLIVTHAAQPIEAVRKATSTIPIVMASVGDALGAGYIASLARPGGNVTGLTLFATEQSAKRLQLIKEISPRVVRVAVLSNANASGHRLQLKEMEQSAPALRIVLQSLAIANADQLDGSLQAAAQADAQAIVTMDDPLVQSGRDRIVQFAMHRRLPLMAEFRPFTEAGGLMSYGPNQLDMWRRAATFVDKILRGAKPADLPVEQPTKFELVINMKTAKALGLDVPLHLQQLADEVIE
jgi:ABC-type uncharacterized transport system substrate-binding protein